MNKNQDFKWKFIKPQDLKEIFEWWNHYGFKKVEPTSLPKLGLMVSKNGINLYSCFIYSSDSDIVWMEWVVSNPKADVKLKRGAFEKMMEVLEVVLKLKGVSKVFTSTNLDVFKNKLKKNDFVETDSNVTHFIKSY